MSKLSDALRNAAKPKKETTNDKMRAAGYIPATEVAKKLGIHLASVYRWVDENQVESIRALGKRYVKATSLISKLGVEQAKIFGFISAAAPAKPTTPAKSA